MAAAAEIQRLVNAKCEFVIELGSASAPLSICFEPQLKDSWLASSTVAVDLPVGGGSTARLGPASTVALGKLQVLHMCKAVASKVTRVTDMDALNDADDPDYELEDSDDDDDDDSAWSSSFEEEEEEDISTS